MDIREMELRTGLNRANIRFYEKEGLIQPDRRENGYRDYSSEDEKTLLRVKLLRRLKVSVEEIRSLQHADEELSAVLSRKLQELTDKRRELEAAQKVCRRIQEDGVSYANLEASWYLQILETEEKRTQPSVDIQPESYVLSRDVEHVQPHPVRRLLARYLDLQLYRFIWIFILGGILRISAANNVASVIESSLALVTMYFLEPLFISCFAATPGKWLMRIRVRNITGEKMSYAAARERTGGAMWRGMGLEIPIYSWIRLWKSYKEYSIEGEESYWNADVDYEFLEFSWRYAAIWAATEAAVFVLIMLTFLGFGTRPIHSGDLTMEQFADNYNHYNDYFYQGNAAYINEQGELESETGVVIYVGTGRPEWSYITQNGIIKEISCTISEERSKIPAILTAAAYLGAQPEVNIWNKGGVLGIIHMLENDFPGSYTVEYGDVTLEVSGTTLTIRKE